jgi:hypothetical protein
MFLMGICMSVLGFGVAAAAFGAATRGLPTTPEPEPEMQPVHLQAPARFFAEAPMPPAPNYASVPVSALLLEIENHVRLEQAAAESFLASPTIDLLHMRTVSSLVQ